jgi:hypothetical protein
MYSEGASWICKYKTKQSINVDSTTEMKEKEFMFHPLLHGHRHRHRHPMDLQFVSVQIGRCKKMRLNQSPIRYEL